MYFERIDFIFLIINILCVVILLFAAFSGLFISETLVRSSRIFSFYAFSCSWMVFWSYLQNTGVLDCCPRFIAMNLFLGSYIGPGLFIFTKSMLFPFKNLRRYYFLLLCGFPGTLLSLVMLTDESSSKQVWMIYKSGLQHISSALSSIQVFMLVLYVLTLAQFVLFTFASLFVSLAALARGRITQDLRQTAALVLFAVGMAVVSMGFCSIMITLNPNDRFWQNVSTVSTLPSILILFYSLYKSRTLLTKSELIHARNLIIENELETARLLQLKLLPDQTNRKSHFPIASTYIPYDKVGGDFFDYHVDAKMAFYFIADVSGHGIPGAFLGLVTKLSLEYALQKSSMPEEILKIINSIMNRVTVRGNFATAFICTIDTETLAMRYCNAGHFPPFVFRKSTGEVFELSARGTALGWLEAIHLEIREMRLEIGDRIVIYTDGITECMDNDGAMFGLEGLIDFTRKHPLLSPQKFSEELISFLKKTFGAVGFEDDLTILVVDIQTD